MLISRLARRSLVPTLLVALIAIGSIPSTGCLEELTEPTDLDTGGGNGNGNNNAAGCGDYSDTMPASWAQSRTFCQTAYMYACEGNTMAVQVTCEQLVAMYTSGVIPQDPRGLCPYCR